MTRGRNPNQAYIAVDRPDDTHDSRHNRLLNVYRYA